MKKKTERWDQDDARIFAFLAVFLSIIGFIIALLGKKNDDYVMYYAKQSLILFLVMVIISVFSSVVLLFGVIGRIIYYSSWVLVAILWLIGSIYALSGERKPIPLLGRYAESLRF